MSHLEDDAERQGQGNCIHVSYPMSELWCDEKSLIEFTSFTIITICDAFIAISATGY